MKNGFLLLFLFLNAGCVTFTSNVDRAAIPQFSRLLVVSKLPNTKPDYLNQFLNMFPQPYEVCITEAGPLALENTDQLISSKISSCNSQVVLTINPYRNYTTGAGEYIASTNEVLIELMNTATQKSFYKAIARASGDHVPSAMQIVKRLRDDGIIVGKLPYAGQRVNY